VEVSGDLRALAVKVGGQPRLFLNGKEASAKVEQGVMVYSR
jgi:hypothetical protein